MTPSPPATAVAWPVDARPAIRTSGRFPLFEREFRYVYRSPTHALHLYEYEGRIRLGEREHALQPGDLTLTPAGIESRYHLPRPGHHLCIHFHPVEGRDGSAVVQLPLHLSLGPRQTYVMRQINEIAHLHSQAGQRSEAMPAAEALLQALLLWLASEGVSTSTRRSGHHADRAVRRVAELIEMHLDRPLSVPRLAEEVGLSQNYLARCFKQRFGTTIPRYALNRRIEIARDLLRTTDLPVRGIAARVGLPDPQHFNKQFRRLTGMSPTAMRERA